MDGRLAFVVHFKSELFSSFDRYHVEDFSPAFPSALQHACPLPLSCCVRVVELADVAKGREGGNGV